MVKDRWQDALEDAEGYLEAGSDRSKPNRVRMTNIIHAVIRANDALLLAHGRDKPDSHETASQDFVSLLDAEGVMDEYGQYEKNLRRILGEKTPAEYTGKGYGNDTVDTYLKQAERFVDAVKDMIAQET